MAILIAGLMLFFNLAGLSQGSLPEESLNIIVYQFLDEGDDVYLEIIPGERFRLPLIRGYRIRIDIDRIEVTVLTDREVLEPDGTILPNGHVAQGFNIGRLSTLEYELLVTFDHQTDRYFVAVREDGIRVRPFREEFSKIITP
jgi:hypothetical protein